MAMVENLSMASIDLESSHSGQDIIEDHIETAEEKWVISVQLTSVGPSLLWLSAC